MVSRILSTLLALTLMSVATSTLEPVADSDLALLTSTDASGVDADSEPLTGSPASEEEEDEREDGDRDDRDEESRSEVERALLSASLDLPGRCTRGAPVLTTKARAALSRRAPSNGFPREEERPPEA